MKRSQKFLSVFLCLSLLACEGEDAVVDDIIDGGEIGDGVNIPEFTPQTDEQLTIPEDPLKYLRRTKVEITLKYHPDLFNGTGGIATSDMYDATSNSFDATSSKMFRIQHPDLVVEDSHGKKLPLELYLMPEKNQVILQTIMVFASLNQIAINFAQVNIAQTAYFLRPLKGANPLDTTAEDMTPNVLNQAHLHPSHGFVPVTDWNKWNAAYLQCNSRKDDKPISKPLTWIAPCFNPTISPSEPDPAKKPCYQPGAGYWATTVDDHAPLLLQPLAPVGYKHMAWDEYLFETEYEAGKQLSILRPIEVIKPTHTDLAMKETQDKFESLRDIATNRDIGWFGLPKEYRSKIVRNHITEIQFKTIEDTSIPEKTNIHIPEGGIKLATYNHHETEPALAPINTSEMILEYKEDNPGAPTVTFD